MRLIADENISWRLKKLLPDWDILPANEIKTDVRLTDRLIWEYALFNDYTILTFDEDFAELQNLLSYPPKIIWLRTGNLRKEDIALTLTSHGKALASFINDPESGIYEIHS